MVKEKHRKAMAKESTRTRTRATAVKPGHRKPTVVIAMKIAALVGRRVTRVRCADQVRARAPMHARWKRIRKTRKKIRSRKSMTCGPWPFSQRLSTSCAKSLRTICAFLWIQVQKNKRSQEQTGNASGSRCCNLLWCACGVRRATIWRYWEASYCEASAVNKQWRSELWWKTVRPSLSAQQRSSRVPVASACDQHSPYSATDDLVAERWQARLH